MDLTGEDRLCKQLKKGLIDRALGAELTKYLGYDPAGRGNGNSRNGSSSKTILTQDGEVEITVPRDRAGKGRIKSPARFSTTVTGRPTHTLVQSPLLGNLPDQFDRGRVETLWSDTGHGCHCDDARD